MRFEAGEGRGRIISITVLNGKMRLWAAPRVNTSGFPSDGLHYSDDGGRNWTKMNYDFGVISDLHPCPSRAGYLYIASTNGLFVLKQGESSPTSLGKGLPSYPRTVSASANPAGVVYAALGSSGIYKSTNYGSNFSNAGPGVSANFNEVGVSKLNGNIAYTMPRASGAYSGLWVTNDGGSNWTRIHSGDSKRINLELFPRGSLGQWIDSPIAIHPSKADTVLIGVNGHDVIVRSENAGATWQYSNSGYCGGISIGGVAFKSDSEYIFSLEDFGLWRTQNDGSTFEPLNTGSMFNASSSYSIAVDGDRIVASLGAWSDKGIILSHDNGRNWSRFSEQSGGGHRFAAFHNSDPNVIYAGRYRSDNNGGSWKTLSYWIRGVYPKNNDIVFAFRTSSDGFECLKSKDRGSTWQTVVGPIKNIAVRDIAIHPTNSDLLWLASDRGVVVIDGNKWQLRDHSHGLEADSHGMRYVERIAVDPIDPKVLYAGRRGAVIGPSNGIFMSTDGGMNWIKVSYNLPDPLDVWSLKISPYKDRSVYIGTSLGTYKLPGHARKEIN